MSTYRFYQYDACVFRKTKSVCLTVFCYQTVYIGSDSHSVAQTKILSSIIISSYINFL